MVQMSDQIILLLLGISTIDDVLEASASPLQQAGQSSSTACPDTNFAHNLALGHWHTTWGKLQCDHAFEEEALAVVVQDVQGQPGQCDVTFYRPFGDLQVRIVALGKKVIASHMRPPEFRDQLRWYAVDRRICRLTSAAGVGPWIVKIPPSLVTFAFNSLSSIRQRFQLVQRVCGNALSLVSNEGLNGLVEHHEQSVTRIFFLEVMEGALTTIVPVHVRIEERQVFDDKTNKSTLAYRFLSSYPPPCQISSSMPFAAFGCSGCSQGPNSGASTRRLNETGKTLEMALGGVAVGPVAQPDDHYTSDDHYTDRKLSNLFSPRRLTSVNTKRNLPAYDMRQFYPRCALPAKSMGYCSADFVFATVGAFEKQLCRLSGGKASPSLSRQHVLDYAGLARGCHGGSVFDAHAAMLGIGGMVTESCAPYMAGATTSTESVAHDFPSVPGLVPSRPRTGADCAQHFAARLPSPAEMAYQTVLSRSVFGSTATNVIIGEGAMQAAILIYGALVSSFALFSDFYLYRQGVYTSRNSTVLFDESSRLGRHIVQILGWGVSGGQKYWIGENSWGSTWGENQNFQQCSVQDCRGPTCKTKNNFSPDCKDSSIWRDEFGNGCKWYVQHDQGCNIYQDSGQMTHCRSACHNCLPRPLQNGEMCGYFRFVRGQNHLGIEAAAMHTYVAGREPPQGAVVTLEDTCDDDPSWVDVLGKRCSWHQKQDPGCLKFQDIGQRAFCRKTCQTCPRNFAKVRPPATIVEDVRSFATTTYLLVCVCACAWSLSFRGC